MSNFKDFDLDLKKVSFSDGNNERAFSLTGVCCDVVTLTIKDKCNSVSAATTGMTVGCCARSPKVNENVAPRCV
ncbi:hypothetical protein FC826_01290 [Clostridium botulinum]|uniref:Uncharacterized protein n=1 Tax=Clostridium botulinum TaxID=1491 RepID=A0A6B4U853_CLOBO|nr:hypothetical protein [Clostridium botulinum]NFD85123.1 hypothetical protein [Clostridium botulinum]NFE09663.1 hypothetical protein [Clostridium botulinum]NFE33996.1 hypothetical protein [Clostridium botulinum]NFE50426.1 hypothetical protein [Clostridium botulinum]